jgi:hypothetical protein
MRAMCLALLFTAVLGAQDNFVPLFNGKNLDGWDVDTASVWSVSNGVLIGKSPGLTYNEFLRTKKSYSNFVLKVSLRLINGQGNSGVQFRSKPSSQAHEVSGFQADASWPQNWGCLYDESRRNKTLACPSKESMAKFDPAAWHEYTITAQGNHIVLELDGVKTVDYVEADPAIPTSGFIAVQVHAAGSPVEMQFKDIRIKALP